MNVLFISPNSPRDSIGGVERFISNLIDYCTARAEHNVYILLPVDKGTFVERIGNVTVYHDENLSISKDLHVIQKDSRDKVHLFAKRVEEIIKLHNIDIICAENFHLGVPPAYSILLNMVAGLYKIPSVLRVHSFAVTELQTELINQLMWAKISCVSKSVAGDCFHKGANIDYLTTDYLGVNTHEFNADANPLFNLKEKLELPVETKILLSATRLILGTKNIIKQKGLVNLIEAFSKISPRYPYLHLVIAVGKPPDRLKNEFTQAYNMLYGYIKLHNIEAKTTVKTYKLGDMASVYKGSDIFVLPSENETFGQVFIESMACGLPVIGTKVGGIPEIISDSYNGYLVTSDDSTMLAQRIEKLINSSTVRNNFREAGLKTVENNFTSEKQFSCFFKTLSTVINN